MRTFFMNILNQIKNNRILSSILLVSGGTLFAQVLTTVTTPIVTRIFTTEEYGVLTTFNSVLSILGIAGALKYELAIPIIDKDNDAFQCYKLSCLILIFMTITIFILIFVGGHSLFDFLGAENLYDYRYMIPIGIFLVQYFAIVIQYSYRMRDFKKVSGTSVKQSIIGNIAKVIFGFMKIGPIGLLVSRILSDSVGSISLSLPILKTRVISDETKDIKQIAKRYKKFPLLQFPSTVVGQLALNLPVFFIGRMYDDFVIGAFGLANTVVNLSIDLIGKSVGNVFYAEAAQIAKTNPNELKALSNSIIKKMGMLGLVPLIVLLLFGKYLFSFVFGKAWVLSGTFASILSIGIYFNFVLNPISRVFEAYEKQGYSLALNLINLNLSFLFFVIAQKFNYSMYVTIAGYTVIRILVSIITFFLSRVFINKQIQFNNTHIG